MTYRLKYRHLERFLSICVCGFVTFVCMFVYSVCMRLQTGYVKLPPEKFAAQKKQGEVGKDLPTEPKKMQLNSAEELYAEIRDKNFNAIGAALSKKAKIISAAFEVGFIQARRHSL